MWNRWRNNAIDKDEDVKHRKYSAISEFASILSLLVLQLLPVSIGTFLAAMDVTIIASSYASIGNDLNQLQITSWIATGYMLSLTSIQYVHCVP